MNINFRIISLLFFMAAFSLAGCGGSGSDSDSPFSDSSDDSPTRDAPEDTSDDGGDTNEEDGGDDEVTEEPEEPETVTVQSGTFYSSAPVQGLRYRTHTQSGTTDETGQFEFVEGEAVHFWIGEHYMGHAAADEIVTVAALDISGLPRASETGEVFIFGTFYGYDNDSRMHRPYNQSILLAGMDSEPDNDAVIVIKEENTTNIRNVMSTEIRHNPENFRNRGDVRDLLLNTPIEVGEVNMDGTPDTLDREQGFVTNSVRPICDGSTEPGEATYSANTNLFDANNQAVFANYDMAWNGTDHDVVNGTRWDQGVASTNIKAENRGCDTTSESTDEISDSIGSNFFIYAVQNESFFIMSSARAKNDILFQSHVEDNKLVELRRVFTTDAFLETVGFEGTEWTLSSMHIECADAPVEMDIFDMRESSFRQMGERMTFDPDSGTCGIEVVADEGPIDYDTQVGALGIGSSPMYMELNDDHVFSINDGQDENVGQIHHVRGSGNIHWTVDGFSFLMTRK